MSKETKDKTISIRLISDTQNKNIQDLNNKTKVLVDIPVEKDKKSLIRNLIANWTQTENKKVLFVVLDQFLLEEHKQDFSDNPNLKITYTTVLCRETAQTLDGFAPELVVLDEIGRTFSLVAEKISCFDYIDLFFS